MKTEIENLDKEKLELQALNIEQALVIKNKLDEVKNLQFLVPKPLEFRKVTEYYKWKPQKNIRLRDALQKFSKDKKYQEKYLKFLDDLKVQNKSNIDDQIYHIVFLVQKWIGEKYKTDKERFGYSEYWLSPQEAYDFYVEDKKYADCEDLSAFLYGCIVAKLIQKGEWENNKDRFKRIDVHRIGGEDHAVLVWKKNSGKYAVIETTLRKDRFTTLWNSERDIFNSVYTDIWHIFDEESEYSL